MVFIPSSLLVSTLLLGSASGSLIAGRQATVTDEKCATLMCVSATVNGTNVEYILSSLGKRPLGWMAMGFGRGMANSPMVIMWEHEGQVVLSHRSAPREVMPTVDLNPPRVATVVDSLNNLAGDNSRFGFTIPANPDETRQFIIFAYGTTPPGSADVDADIIQHFEYRSVQLDLTGSSSPSPTTSGSTTNPTRGPASGNDPSDDIPLLPYQRMIVAHAIFCVVGFLLFLPAGALLARYVRVFSPTWFMGHWIAQFAVAGPTIIAGIALGIGSVTKAGAMHLNDNHKKLGVAVFVLYIFQLFLGAVIHWVKPRNTTRRPIQNYAHAILGLLIIALAMVQVHSGFTFEWPRATGRELFPNSVNIIFYVWIAVITAAYFGGLALLPKQYKQENQPKRLPVIDDNHSGYRDRD